MVELENASCLNVMLINSQSVAGRRVVYFTRTGSTMNGQITLFRALTFSTRGSRVDLWTEWLIFKSWKASSNNPGVIYAWE